MWCGAIRLSMTLMLVSLSGCWQAPGPVVQGYDSAALDLPELEQPRFVAEIDSLARAFGMHGVSDAALSKVVAERDQRGVFHLTYYTKDGRLGLDISNLAEGGRCSVDTFLPAFERKADYERFRTLLEAIVRQHSSEAAISYSIVRGKPTR